MAWPRFRPPPAVPGTPPEPPTSRAGRLRAGLARWLRRAGLALVALLLLAAALALAIDLGWQRERLIGLAIAAAREQLGLDVEIARVSGRASRGLTLHGVRIGAAGEPLFECDRLSARWYIPSLLDPAALIVDHVQLEGWRVLLRRDEAGDWPDLEALETALGSEPQQPEASGAATRGVRVRRIEVGPGRAELRLANGLRAGLRVEAALRRLRVEPDRPVVIERLSFSARLADAEAPWQGMDSLEQVELDVVLEGSRIASARAHVEASGLRVDAQAEGDLERFERLTVEASAEDLSWLSAFWPGQERPTGRGQLSAELHGAWDALVGSARLDVEQIAAQSVRARLLALDVRLDEPVGSLPIDPFALSGRVSLLASEVDAGRFAAGLPVARAAEVAVEADVRGGHIAVSEARWSGPGLRVSGRGRVSPERFDEVSLDFSLEDVAPWIALLELEGLPALPSGRARGEARLTGPFEAPVGRIALTSGPLRLGERRLAPVTLEARREDGNEARFKLGWGVEGMAPWQLEGQLDLPQRRLRFQGRGPAEALDALLVEPLALRGQLAIEGFVRQASDGPEFELDFEAREASIRNLGIGALDLRAHGRPLGEIVVDRLEVTGTALWLEVREPVRWQGSPAASWALTAPGVWLGATPPDASAADERDPDARPGAQGAPGSRRAESTEASDTPQTSGFVALSASGEGDAAKAVELRFERLPAALIGRLALLDVSLGGLLDGEAQWFGDRDDDWTHGRARWQSPEIDRVRLDEAGLDWSSTETTVEARLGIQSAIGEPLGLTVQAEVPREDRQRPQNLRTLTIRAELDALDLATFDPLTPRWMRRLSGEASGRIELSRAGDAWHRAGELTIQQAGFSVPLLRRRFSPIEGRVSLRDERVLVEALRVGRAGRGATIEATLDLSDEQTRPIAGRLTLDHLPISRSPLLNMDAGGEVALSGSLNAPVIEGVISLESTRVRVPAADDAVLKEIRIATQAGSDDLVEPDEAGLDPLRDARVDLTFKVPSTTRVMGQGANLFVQGEARLNQLPGEPARLRGEAEVVNGTYTFQGRRFRVRRGGVRLTGDAGLDPLLDVEAHLPVKDILAIVEVTGRLSSPAVRLTSAPARSEQDVLAYLIFGRPASEVGAAQTARFDAAATRLVAGVAERELREILGDAMPVDSIEIGEDAEGATSELGFGKYLGPDLFIRYVHVLGDEPSDRVGVEYRLNDLFSIGSSVSTTGDAGVDLILRQDF